MPPMCMYMVEKQDGFVTDFHEVHYGSKGAWRSRTNYC